MSCCNCQTRRGLKICCAVTAVLILVIAAVLITLYFTIFKPKEPKIVTQLVTLEHIKLVPIPGLLPIPVSFHLNITLGLLVTVHNPNYGSFRYQNSTAYITYRGVQAAQAPIHEDNIPARAQHNVSTDVVVMADKVISDTYFLGDIFNGSLNFSSSTKLHGKATIFKIFKLKATTFSTCDISVFIKYQNATAACKSKIHL
nr:late embryogenesis abundant protein At1g64065-like [Ipomoea batatas]GMD86364.1 late embryogenesis abundant protein At1g64065-like [Ipomoea batatas]GME20573.1 late embryogenesis abundant protein At1g64065-like [Ipomoea batatas]